MASTWPGSCRQSCFSPIHEASLPSSLVLASCCPTMDLVAVVTADSQLSVHRLNWQRLWSVPLDTPVTALCWRPDGKVLATGTSAGRLVLYDVGACEVLSSAPAVPGSTTRPIVHLCWTDGPTPAPMTTYKKMFAYRHTRLFSQPVAGQATTELIDLTSTFGRNEWPASPEVLNMLVCSNDQGHITLAALGSFPVAHVTSQAAPLPAGNAAADSPRDQEGVTVQACSVLSRDLRHVLHTQRPPGGSSALQATLLDAGHVAAGAEPLLRVAVLLNQATAMMQASTVALTKAGQAWKTAHTELTKRLDGLRSCLTEHQEMPAETYEDTAGPAGGGGAGGELSLPGDAEDQHLLGELVCMLASGHVSPGMRSWLCGSLAEHGVRRLAQQLDSAINSAFALITDEVSPCLEVVVFILGELQGLADPLLQGAGAHALGLQRDACVGAAREGCRALLQCEALGAGLTRLGAQYRAFFTWMLKTVLSLELGSAAQQASPSAPGTAAGVASLQVDVGAVLQLLEGPLLQDTLSPDMAEGWSDPDITPASLTFDPAIPLEAVKRLMDCVHGLAAAPPHTKQGTGASGSAYSMQEGGYSGGSYAGSYGGSNGMDTSSAGDQTEPQGSTGTAGGATGTDVEPEGADAPPASGLWPDRPLRKQLVCVSGLLSELCSQLSASISPGLKPLAQVTLLPDLPVRQHTPEVTALASSSTAPDWFAHVTELSTATTTISHLEPLPAGTGCASGPQLVVVARVGADLMQAVTCAPTPSPLAPQAPATSSGMAAAVAVAGGRQGILCCSLAPGSPRAGSQEAGSGIAGRVGGVDQQPGAADGAGAGGLVCAVLLVLPASHQVLDLAPYRSGQVAALLQCKPGVEEQAGGQAGPQAHLVLLPPPRLRVLEDWVEQGSVLLACLAQGAVEWLQGDMLQVVHADAVSMDAGTHAGEAHEATPCMRSRMVAGAVHGTGGAPAPGRADQGGVGRALVGLPLTVGASRGVAVVLPGGNRAQVWDLEEDEEGEEEEEEGEEESEGSEDMVDDDEQQAEGSP